MKKSARIRCLPAVLGTLLSLPALAADDGYTPAYSTCMDASGGVTANMVDCMAAETRIQDARLNQGYQAAMQALDAEHQARLRDVQRLWIKYRDANCSLHASFTGGTIDRINGASCVLDMTKTRADELASFVVWGK
ncbi:lysozyme inhibitor LprI family protein [Azotobacter armeniacus]